MVLYKPSENVSMALELMFVSTRFTPKKRQCSLYVQEDTFKVEKPTNNAVQRTVAYKRHECVQTNKSKV